MGKTRLIFLAMLLMLVFAVGTVQAIPLKHWKWGDNINLVEKNPADWSKVPKGASGNFWVGPFEQRFTLSAKGLEQNTTYTLLSYAEPYPGKGSKVIGTETSNNKGVVKIKGAFSNTDSVVYNIYASDAAGDYRNTVGAKIWLVKTADLSISTDGKTASFIVWNPTTYLFETTLVDYPDLDNLKLVEKDSAYQPVVGGMQGTFATTKTKYMFKASKLTPSTSYTLISYDEDWGSVNPILATGTSGKKGNLVLTGSSFTSSLVYNTYTSGEYAGLTGAKIWLVPTNELAGGVLTSWNPSAYLFETHLILA
ncbi:MAG: hypothetical protein M0Q91_18050 [Methanoregula sp.]|nr:hypothetical protein [Methanoregula sp.]